MLTVSSQCVFGTGLALTKIRKLGTCVPKNWGAGKIFKVKNCIVPIFETSNPACLLHH